MAGRRIHHFVACMARRSRIVMMVVVHRIALGMTDMHMGSLRGSSVRGTAGQHRSRSKPLHGDCHDQQPQQPYFENAVHFFSLSQEPRRAIRQIHREGLQVTASSSLKFQPNPACAELPRTSHIDQDVWPEQLPRLLPLLQMRRPDFLDRIGIAGISPVQRIGNQLRMPLDIEYALDVLAQP
jgi:hypothetical protein